MRVTITYSYGPTSEYPISATIKLPNGEYACCSGKTREEAKQLVIERALVKTVELPLPEEVEI